MNLVVVSQDPATVSADALVVNVFDGERPENGRLAGRGRGVRSKPAAALAPTARPT